MLYDRQNVRAVSTRKSRNEKILSTEPETAAGHLAGALFRGYCKENITLLHRHTLIQHGNDFRFYRLPVFSELLHWKVNKHHRYYDFFVTTFS